MVSLRNTMLFFCLFIGALHAQDSYKTEYELQMLEIEILRSYYPLNSVSKSLLDSATFYAQQDEYDFALIFLEEVKSTTQAPPAETKLKILENDTWASFQFNAISGIDYNRQEFEVSFEQSDSVLIDELNKPFIGFNVLYQAGNDLSFSNKLRYDKENFQNELYLQKEYYSDIYGGKIKAGNVVDNNTLFEQLSYTEFYSEFELKKQQGASGWYWNLRNLLRYKNFEGDGGVLNVTDFVRNAFAFYASKTIGSSGRLQADYNLDFNNSINSKDNDFTENTGAISYQDRLVQMDFLSSFRLRHNAFNYVITGAESDSLFSNESATLSYNQWFSIPLINNFELNVNYNFDLKKYTTKSEQEPDYTLHYLNPTLTFHLNSQTDIKLGYVIENKQHVLAENLIAQYIEDQNYNAHGVSFGTDYSTLGGTFIAFSAEYTRRRYNDILTDIDFNIYSNRNILSFLLFAQLPVTDSFMVNLLASFDNDKDVDNDLNDSISSFYTLEMRYTF